jgi:hypothetical protein
MGTHILLSVSAELQHEFFFKPPPPFFFAGKVINGVKTAADVARVLGIEAKAS